jgi:hypothetical protein
MNYQGFWMLDLDPRSIDQLHNEGMKRRLLHERPQTFFEIPSFHGISCLLRAHYTGASRHT